MKIKTKELSYEKVITRIAEHRIRPKRPNPALRWLIGAASKGELKRVNFTYEMLGMERLRRDEPCLILMNHSSFIDLKIASVIFADRPFNIVCTADGFVGKSLLMQHIGCIPTNKFITDVALVKSMVYAVKDLKDSILMYPEASYSFDGTSTPLPDNIGKCIKLLKVPVIMVRTYGAFQRDPLYNNLQVRDVKVSADVEYVLSPEEIAAKTPEEIKAIMDEKFSFDHFRWQEENQVVVDEDFRADYLNRVLYKCPDCLTEGKMVGKGIYLTCTACGKKYELTEIGKLRALEGKARFEHIPQWYAWQRECVRRELKEKIYHMKAEVDICMMVNMKCLYKVGTGILEHGIGGFHLQGCDGKIDFSQAPQSSYSLYADYFWYEIGDVICIGDHRVLYYCFPKNCGDIVAKTRLATEELYKLVKEQKGAKRDVLCTG